ncbi:acyltransferase [Myroides indicus]|uniref:Acetyltransferase-like isoleucine patch superfamily enzyme n=1 Tax=Myroides indicus TaxID=1323422 RepID=A0A4R7F4N8_9FLAO|nr:acyltransferase [Myroides indicus]TDS65017.1 acetyltransferase-like isoleucine patch superfamily enzyme [Myroides indicus]
MIFVKLYSKFRSYFWSEYVKRKCYSHGKKIKANRRTILSKNVILGENVNFNGMKISKGGIVRIGNNFHSGDGCRIIAQHHNYEGECIPYDKTYINSNITIEDNVWLGHNVIILGNITIGEGAIIQAGSTVVSNIPKYAIAGGHPAKVFKNRDIDHYEILKKQEKFL